MYVAKTSRISDSWILHDDNALLYRVRIILNDLIKHQVRVDTLDQAQY